MIRAVEPHMRKLGKARSSTTLDRRRHRHRLVIPYAASKAALNLMTKSLAHVLGPEIRINAVVPGMIQTRWLKGGWATTPTKRCWRTRRSLPLKEVATAEDIAETLVWFLVGAGSRLITGETLIVDSGIHLGRCRRTRAANRSRHCYPCLSTVFLISSMPVSAIGVSSSSMSKVVQNWLTSV